MSIDVTPTIADSFSRFLVDVVRTALEQIESERTSNVQSPGPGLYDRKGAAEYLAISPSSLDDLRKAGQIKVVHIGEWPKYARKELDRYIERLRKDEA